MLGRAGLFMGVLGLSGCLHHHPPAAGPVAHPHYELGAAYQANGFWYYPAEDYGFDTTGLATVSRSSVGLTADGELRDPGGLTGAMQTVQLPAIVEVTNLENGRQIMVRVNDRGPASPGRIIALSPRAALLLQARSDGTQVRVRLDQAMSHQVVDQLGGGPQLHIATAPSATITAEALPPPGGGAAGPAQTIGAAQAERSGPAVPDRLPERVTAGYARRGTLILRCGTFGRFNYANTVAAKLAGLGADVVRSRDGRQTRYDVQAGPFANVAAADAALAQALRAGVIDSRIVVQ